MKINTTLLGSIPGFELYIQESHLEFHFEEFISLFRIPYVSNEISGVLPKSWVDDVPPDHTININKIEFYKLV